MSSFNAEVLDIGGAGFAHTEPVEAEEHGQGGVVAVVLLGGEQEDAELGAVETASGRRMNLGSPDVLGRVRGDATVDVGEPVEPTYRRQAPVDRCRRQAPLLHPGAVELDVRPRRGEHAEPAVGRPLEEPAQVVAVGVECASAVAGQESDRGELRLIDDQLLLGQLDRPR